MVGNEEVGKGGEGTGERRCGGEEECNKANPFDKTDGDGET